MSHVEQFICNYWIDFAFEIPAYCNDVEMMDPRQQERKEENANVVHKISGGHHSLTTHLRKHKDYTTPSMLT